MRTDVSLLHMDPAEAVEVIEGSRDTLEWSIERGRMLEGFLWRNRA